MTPWPGVTTLLTSAQMSLAVWTCSGIYHGFFLNLFYCSTSSLFRPLTIVMLSGPTVPMLKLNVTHHQPTTTHMHHQPSNTTSLWSVPILVKKLSALQELWRGNLFQAMLEFARIIQHSVNCAAHDQFLLQEYCTWTHYTFFALLHVLMTLYFSIVTFDLSHLTLSLPILFIFLIPPFSLVFVALGAFRVP